MAKLDKLLMRFQSKPKDFTWKELNTLLTKLGFKELQGSGPRVKFYHQQKNCLIHMHKPHPTKILKPYMVNEILEILLKGNFI